MTKKEIQEKKELIIKHLKRSGVMDEEKIELNKKYFCTKHLSDINLTKYKKVKGFHENFLVKNYLKVMGDLDKLLKKLVTDVELERYIKEQPDHTPNVLAAKFLDNINNIEINHDFIKKDSSIFTFKKEKDAFGKLIETNTMVVNQQIFVFFGIIEQYTPTTLTLSTEERDNYWTIYFSTRTKPRTALCFYIEENSKIEDILKIYTKALEYLGF